MASTKEPWGENVLVDFEDGLTWVRFNRPTKKNAMSPALNEEMRATVNALATDDRCKVFILSGEGESFSAGMDLKEYFRMTDGAPDTVLLNVRRVAEDWQWRRLRDYPKPTIAMVNGWCFGGAFTPVVGCDLAVAADEAIFGLSEINWGIIPAGNVTKATIETMGYRNAMKRVKYMDWEVSADYLYAKMAEALHLGGAENRANAMKAFLDDKSFRPGIEHFQDTK
jgi:trans-feruloyl-CoA hydratase/vanillin synthase